MSVSKVLAWTATAAALVAGCQKPVHFPMDPLPQRVAAARAFDADGDGKGDFFLYANPGGRTHKVGYDTNRDGKPDETVDLDALPLAQCRHLVMILDGVGYDVVKRHYDAGGLRMFHPPSRVVAPYPTLTDPCLEDMLGYIPCPAFEAEFFDRRGNRLAGGSSAYLSGRNAPYDRLLHYRAGLLWDAIGYVYPRQVFGKEMNDAKRLFDRRQTQEVLAYFVSSAGAGTKMGAEGQIDCLRRIEQFVHQVLWETRGLTKFTLLSDHGHSYTPAKRIGLEEHLTDRGWRLTKRLGRPKDVVYVRFGLETYASFATDSPEALAKDLIAAEGVEIASFAKGATVVVLGRQGARAVVHHKAGRFRYEPVSGDPLRLAPALATLKPDAEGYRGADELLAATVTHTYPAPLQRLWRAHFALVENPPDVIVSLEDHFFSGSDSLARTVNVASTHGGLNCNNSTAFIMSTIGELPAFMRSRDIPKNMEKLTGRAFPARK
ncbi:MAG TPA: hypothetical protein VMZ50_01980 [Phycisphaerae bacterium]|nr:hypothetical protein [Phycisphaerae bacterium]